VLVHDGDIERSEDRMQERSVESLERENAFLREELAEARARLARIAEVSSRELILFEAERVIREAD
jgi:Tfp pilus assembly protein PilN